MRVLVTESRFGDADGLVDRLRATGCQVSVCHSGSGVCQALAPGRCCPLDFPDAVALAVDVRSTEPELSAREFGVVCAIRSGIQVVAVPAEPGLPVTAPDGLASRVRVVSADRLVDTCDHALRTEAATCSA